MKTNERDRRSNITVTVINVEKVMDDIESQLKESGEWPENKEWIQPRGLNWAYTETPDGIFLLDNEACGPGGAEDPITDECDAEWPLYYHTENSIAMFPDVLFTVSLNMIRKFPTDGNMNFGEWVRTFGARLESNFHNWNKFLEEAMGVRPPCQTKIH